jgi:hypothetical protein
MVTDYLKIEALYFSEILEKPNVVHGVKPQNSTVK